MPRIADVLERESRGRRPRAGRLRAAARPTRAQATQPADPCGRPRRHRGARDGDRPRPLADVGRHPGGSARRAQAGAGGVGHPRLHPRRRRLRRRSGRLERGQDRGRPFRRGLLRLVLASTGPRDRCGRRTAGTSPSSLHRLWRRDAVPGGRRDQRRGRQRARHVPRARDGTSGGRPIPPASRCGTASGETIGVYGLDGARQTQLTMPAWWSLPGDVDPGWMPDGTSVHVDPDVELPLDGGAPRRLPEGAPSDRRRRPRTASTSGSTTGR